MRRWYEPRKDRPDIPKDAKKKRGVVGYLEILWREFFTLVGLNLLFIVTCLPVITIPASITAMSQITVTMVRDKNHFLFADYFRAFKRDFWRSLVAGLVFFVLIAVFGFSTYFYYTMGQNLSEGNSGGLGGLIMRVIANFGENTAVDVGALVAVRILHTALVNLSQQHLGKALVPVPEHIVKTEREIQISESQLLIARCRMNRPALLRAGERHGIEEHRFGHAQLINELLDIGIKLLILHLLNKVFVIGTESWHIKLRFGIRRKA